MTDWSMDVIGWRWIMALVLCTPNEVFVKASLEVNNTQQQPYPINVYSDLGLTRNKIITAQFECYQKIMKGDGPKSQDSGSMCNSTWDGWLCWEDTNAGLIVEQHCPDYFQDFDPSEMVAKICTDSGSWFLHPDSNRTWTNYTRCNAHTKEGRMTAMNLLYLALIGHGLSVTSLLISLGIFFYFKSLSCQRITLHKNLFFSFVLNSMITIISLTAVANNQELVQRNPTSCKVSQFIHLYLFGCNYFWMLCEGIYLHTLIVVAVFAEKQHLMWYYLLGWGFPLIPACIHAIARSYYYNDNCWISSNTSLLYIIHGPICAALLVNLFFLLNIVRVLITKLKVTHQAESSLYMKAVRATLILIPLLGIQFVLLPYKPEGRVSSEIYDYIMHILMHYQGLLVATIFCFFNGEVQGGSPAELEPAPHPVWQRSWAPTRTPWRSASYTASSITEVQGCYSIDSHSEHMNGTKDGATLRRPS
ncbi:Calcitonin gene-related peptide type 1 receptor [Merluccius polli]|uniref:Calcitonin gene-related peptide type 1 receptor n=1 Tax=Merluccius polli TaxID=89951 RepID=A0AA47M6X3_MERPO|nr:Calcitonin gene-related peptide type 1 receptor [Merluccius polli]